MAIDLQKKKKNTHRMGSTLQRKGEYGICHRIFLWHIPKKKSETSKYEISDLTTCMVLAKKKKRAPSQSLSLTLSQT